MGGTGSSGWSRLSGLQIVHAPPSAYLNSRLLVVAEFQAEESC